MVSIQSFSAESAWAADSQKRGRQGRVTTLPGVDLTHDVSTDSMCGDAPNPPSLPPAVVMLPDFPSFRVFLLADKYFGSALALECLSAVSVILYCTLTAMQIVFFV